VERYADVIEEAKPLLARHWEEIALFKDKVKLAPDYDKYAELAEGGNLHICTVRSDGELIGYHAAFLSNHPHYKNDLMALTDIFYLTPEFRRGLLGFRFFRFIEGELKKLGVVKMMAGSKTSLDLRVLFIRLGWIETDIMHGKYIGD
jgi:GNAT superfamily N-acetyltransferase